MCGVIIFTRQCNTGDKSFWSKFDTSLFNSRGFFFLADLVVNLSVAFDNAIHFFFLKHSLLEWSFELGESPVGTPVSCIAMLEFHLVSELPE